MLQLKHVLPESDVLQEPEDAEGEVGLKGKILKGVEEGDGGEFEGEEARGDGGCGQRRWNSAGLEEQRGMAGWLPRWMPGSKHPAGSRTRGVHQVGCCFTDHSPDKVAS